MAVACGDVMRTHQNSSLTSAIKADSNAELSGVVWMEAQDSIFSLYLLQKILMYPTARTVRLVILCVCVCSLSQGLVFISVTSESFRTDSGYEESQLFLLTLQTCNKAFTDL